MLENITSLLSDRMYFVNALFKILLTAILEKSPNAVDYFDIAEVAGDELAPSPGIEYFTMLHT